MGLLDFLRLRPAPIVTEEEAIPIELSAMGLVRSGGLYQKTRLGLRADETVETFRKIYKNREN